MCAPAAGRAPPPCQASLPLTAPLAAQVEKNGKAPVAFALSDLVDNSLLATHGMAAGRQRRIVISFVRGRSAADSLLSIADNGRGMTRDVLEVWCVPF